ncbi:MAG: hypothetical protein II879_05450, partial [Clostridia bacterium]|nr:hypothetical protein [Clostridia bacterium]
MKKSILCIYMAVLLLAVGAVSAQATTAVYDFDDLHARLSLDNSAYDMVLTPATLDAHRDWLTAQGADFEQTTIRFEDDGVLLEAYDSTNKRTLVVTALADVNAREL